MICLGESRDWSVPELMDQTERFDCKLIGGKMYRELTALALILSLGSFTLGLAQGKETAGTRLNRVIDKIRIKEEKWELRSKTPNEKNAMAYWRFGKQEAAVKIVEYDSESEAITAFRRNERLMSNAGIPTATNGFGDEAFLWDNPGRKSAALSFRKGTRIVLVNADSASIARKFARYAVEQL
jgi:hypothetical protein